MSRDRDPLQERLGEALYKKRLKRQSDKLTRFLHQGKGIFRLENVIPFDAFLAAGLKMLGLSQPLRKAFLDVRIVYQDWWIPEVPAAFDGFRLLQITDLHCDLDDSLAPVVEKLIRATPHDAAVITGDFRNGMEGCHATCVRETRRIVEAMGPMRWAVLGNHDFLEIATDLESIGLPVLLNEVAFIERSGERIWFAGIDDPHYYKTHDIAGVRAKIPDQAFAIMLSHSPETYSEAESHGFHLQLSGHTHGGQVCLPGGRAVVVPCRVARKFISGKWQHGRLQGYTSPGTGACGVAARWNCPPEITLHTLRRPKSSLE